MYRYLKYKGQCYDVGTKIRFRQNYVEYVGTIVYFNCNSIIVEWGESRKFTESIYQPWLQGDPEKVIIEIIEPVYYVGDLEPQKIDHTCPPQWQIENAWYIYIFVMILLTIFEARLTGWIFVTLYFIAWKNGFFNGGNNNER